jgi:hypothetical protein
MNFYNSLAGNPVCIRPPALLSEVEAWEARGQDLLAFSFVARISADVRHENLRLPDYVFPEVPTIAASGEQGTVCDVVYVLDPDPE